MPLKSSYVNGLRRDKISVLRCFVIMATLLPFACRRVASFSLNLQRVLKNERCIRVTSSRLGASRRRKRTLTTRVPNGVNEREVTLTSHQKTQHNESFSKTRVRRMRKDELVEELNQRNVNASGTRGVLMQRLMDNLFETQPRDGGNVGKPLSTVARHRPRNGESSASFENDLIPASAVDSRTTTTVQEGTLLEINGTVGSKLADLPLATAALEAVQEETRLVDTNRTYVLRVKGHSKLNSSGTGVGMILYDDEESHRDGVWQGRKYLAGDRSSSLAAYTALILGLQYALLLGLKHIIAETDNEVMAKQLKGRIPVPKESSIKQLYWQVMNLIESGLESFQVRDITECEDTLELAQIALATGKSLNMTNESISDPMGKGFVGLGKQKHESAGPIVGNDEVPVIDPSRTYLLQFDGGARGNPVGKAGCGMVLFDDQGTEVWCGWKYLDPPMTNNVAEYNSVLLGLRCARSLGITKLRAQGDSELVVRQINGMYRVKEPRLKELFLLTKEATEEFEQVDISYIPRTKNRRADWLANKAMDSETSFGFEETVHPDSAHSYTSSTQDHEPF